ncbi:glycoside hydrolase family 78 protein [Plicaturopsis crispa FD-325 SS-3]|uniref:Unplaced genomic scaffold PLICRscaffold_15, whole genome shotgun sequence n=1 Tax=Plicaturopsis crispa FD-325 SS-3 TaxID=944288 RepID=A0A0C9TA01_PLICR|nr:glycoside hydrolase family 78 protein [Plicaturopsis crispa FD-325 SS-3]
MKVLNISLWVSALWHGSLCAPSGPWDAFNYAPHSKIVSPHAIYRVEGNVTHAANLVAGGGATISGNGSWVTVDFDKEVGGLISWTFDAVSSTSAVSLSFTESPSFVRPYASDDSTYPEYTTTYDGVLNVPAPLSPGKWTQPAYALRGGFRYLTIVSTSDVSVTISNITCAISFMPHVDDLRAYTGYFYAADPNFPDKNFLTKLWYAGAYTVQTNTVALETGRQIPVVASPGWANNATLGVAGPIIVDGDMGIAVPTQFVSTNDLAPTRNALSTMFAAIDPVTGALPESGPPLSQTGSDTYHCWTLIGTYNYYLYSGDTAWLQNIWSNYTKAVAFLDSHVDSSGLFNVTGLRDWARLGGGGHNSEGNALYYKVLTNSASLATYLNETETAAGWARNASALKVKFNETFWVPSAGLYRDNDTTTLHPQDANSLAVIFNLTTPEQAASVSRGLQQNWNDLGPVAPELPDTISPFISGFELQAHFESGNDARAMDLLHREWGYMLYTNLSVQSTLLEGFTANGSLGGYNYDAAYTSHSHGWSSGPTSALTFYVAGLTVTSPQGRTWSVAPHLSGLSAAEGGFETPLGWYGAHWQLSDSTFSLRVETPSETTGAVRLPLFGKKVTVDGQTVQSGNATLDLVVAGGNHTVVVDL